MSEQTVRRKVNRNLKQVPIIACISAAGASVISYSFASQDSADVREQSKKHGARLATDYNLKTRAKPYINREIFREYVCTVFLPDFNELPNFEEVTDEDALRFMQNSPRDIGEEIRSPMRDARIRIITWTASATHIFQEFDICLSEVLKPRRQCTLPFDDDQATIGLLRKIYQRFNQIMIEPNI
jgi:hypothetical protein